MSVKLMAVSRHRVLIAAAGAAALCLGVLILSLGAYRPAPAAVFVEYKTDEMETPTAIAAAPDGTVWFTLDGSAALGRVRDGRLERVPTPGEAVQPLGLGVAADRTVWYTDSAARAIARLTPDGAVARYTLGTPSVRLARLAVAPDGAAWFAEPTGYSITRLKDGALTRHVFDSPRGAPYGVAASADGSIWATLEGANQILHIAPDGSMEATDVPRDDALPSDIAVGPDGSAWFIEFRTDRIARLKDGRFQEYEVGETAAGLSGLAVASDGTVWFGMLRTGSLGRLRDGKVERYKLPRDRARPCSIALDGAGNVWYADISGYIGRLTPPPS